MSDFSISKKINHRFHVNNKKVRSGIGYYIIIDRDLMVLLGLTADFKRQFLQRDGDMVHKKESRDLLVKSDLNKRNMFEVVMQTVETAS